MKIIANIIKKIKTFLNNFTKRNNNNFLNKPNIIETDNSYKENVINKENLWTTEKEYYELDGECNEQEYIETYNYSVNPNYDFEKEKKRILELYDCVKKRIVNINNVDNCDLVPLAILKKKEEKILMNNKIN